MKRIQTALLALAAFVFEPLRRYFESNLVLYVYSGTTAASTDRNPPIRLTGGIGDPSRNTYNGVLSPTTAQSTERYVGGSNLWYHCSSDSATIASSPGYFTDGAQLGMKTGDVMMYVHQSSYGTSPDLSFGVIVTSNSSAGYNMAIGGVIQSS